MRRFFFVALVGAWSSGCPAAICPEGEVAVQGACYPADAVAQVDGHVPVLCEPACSGELHCDYSSGTCVSCAIDTHCTNPAEASCDPSTHVCAGCAGDSDCARFDDAPFCDTVRGACAACTPENEIQVCGDGVCDVITGRCTNYARHSAGACDRCHADSECGDSMRCVLYSFFGHTPEHVCLFDSDQVLCATNASSPIAPYVVQGSGTTLRGESVGVCEPASSCGALADYAAGKSCQLTSDCAGPPGASLCPTVGELRPGVCTIFCAKTSSGYAGCLGTDTCDGLHCVPAP